MQQFPTFLYAPATHIMEMQTAHCKALLSHDTQATDICCPDIMSAKLSHVECFLKPHQGGVFTCRRLHSSTLYYHSHISWHINIGLFSSVLEQYQGIFNQLRVTSFFRDFEQNSLSWLYKKSVQRKKLIILVSGTQFTKYFMFSLSEGNLLKTPRPRSRGHFPSQTHSPWRFLPTF